MLTSPKCNQNYETTPNQHLSFWIILDNGQKENLMTLTGINIKNNLEITFEINKVRTFSFEYSSDENNKLNKILGNSRNEIQILKNDTEIIFDGYINSNTTTNQMNENYSLHRVECVGTEQVFYTDYVKGLATYVNLTSKEILDRVGKEYNKRDDNRLMKPAVSSSLKTKWLEALNIDGQYSRLFDIIKDREKCQYNFLPNGEIHFNLESELPDGGDLILFDNMTIPHMTNLNETRINRGVFKYRDVRGALIWEKIRNTNPKETSVKVTNPIYDIKSITINGESGFKKSINETKDKSYSFNDNEISVKGVDSLTDVKVTYWAKDSSGVVVHDDEMSVVDNLKIREKTSAITTQEISNERISSIQDVYGQVQEHINFVNRPQYRVEFTILDLSTNHNLTNHIIDLHKYKWNDNKWHPELKQLDYLVPHKKVIKLRISDGCRMEKIPLENFMVEITLESDQSNRSQNEQIRDKNQNERHQQNTINIIMHHEWDLGSCDVYDSQQFTKDNLTTQSIKAIPSEEFPRNHVDTLEKLVTTPSGKFIPNADKIDCLTGNNAYLRGMLWYQVTNYPTITNPQHSRMYIVPSGITDVQTWLTQQNIPTISAYDQELFVKVGNNWHLWVKDNTGTLYEVPGNLATPDHWVPIPVDVRIFDSGTNTVATTWDVSTEWGITGRNSQTRRHKFYYDPFSDVASLYPITPNVNSAIPVEEHPETDWSQKFTDWKGTWYTSLAHAPKNIWDDTKCTIKDGFWFNVTSDSKSGESTGGSVADRINGQIFNPNSLSGGVW